MKKAGENITLIKILYISVIDKQPSELVSKLPNKVIKCSN